MTLARRPLLLAALAAPAIVRAQAPWAPTRPVRMIVPFAAGGLTDILTRACAEQLAPRLGQPVVVENRGGAGGNLAAEAVARAEPDGHTLLIATQGIIAINKALYPRLSYDPDTDFTPLAMLAEQPNMVVVNPNTLPVSSIAELIARARAEPGRITYGSGGVGSFTHLSTEIFRAMAGIDITHVPYRGSGPMMQDLVGGSLAMAFDGIGTSLPQVQAGRLRALAVSSARRFRATPDLPAVAETLPGYDATPWYGVFGPARAPAAVTERLAAELHAVVVSPAWAQFLEARAADAVPATRAELIARMDRERPLWREAVARSGARAE